jgi:membrane protease YdiL (CAAX protease family)
LDGGTLNRDLCRRTRLLKRLFLAILKILIFFVGWAVLSGIIDIPVDNPAVWRFFAELIPFAVIIVFTIVFLLIEKKNINIPIKDNIGKGTLIGSVVGSCWIGIASGVLLLSKQLTIVEKNNVSMPWLWIISAFINVVMQELLVRGYIYQLLKQKYNLPAAVIVTTALFTFMHGGAFEAGIIPVINVITMCLFTTALYESERTLIAPIMAHAIWNIIGSLFLGGVSLADDYPHILTMTASSNTVLSGGDYKIEASIVTLILNVVLMIVFYIRFRKRKIQDGK